MFAVSDSIWLFFILLFFLLIDGSVDLPDAAEYSHSPSLQYFVFRSLEVSLGVAFVQGSKPSTLKPYNSMELVCAREKISYNV